MAPNPDAELVQRSARRVGWYVAVLCAGMVLAGAALVFGALYWKSTVHPEQDPGTRYLHVAIDPIDLALAGAVIGLGAILLAGVAAGFFAHRATRPLADALDRQRNFVADASHELRTPLAVLDTRVQHLAALTKDDERLRPLVGELRTDSRALTDIVDDLLQLATAAPIEGSANLKDAVAQAATNAGSTCHVETSVPDEVVAVPPTALRRVFTALVTNAVNHSPEGSTITISGEVKGPFVVVCITDHGHGIQGIAPERIFDRFAGGTGGSGGSHGIGLALVRDTVTRCGGSITLERSDASGTEFVLELPRKETP